MESPSLTVPSVRIYPLVPALRLGIRLSLQLRSATVCFGNEPTPMTIIQIRPSRKFNDAWEAFEAPGIEPVFAAPGAKQHALDYALTRFGGRTGEIHVYDSAGIAIVEKTVIDDRGPYTPGHQG